MLLRMVLIVAPFCILAVLAATELFLRMGSGKAPRAVAMLGSKGLGVSHRGRWQKSRGRLVSHTAAARSIQGENY